MPSNRPNPNSNRGDGVFLHRLYCGCGLTKNRKFRVCQPVHVGFSKSNYGFNRNDRACAQGMNLRVTERLAKSKRIVIGKNQACGSPQYLEVKRQRPVFDIIKVVIDPVDDLVDTVQCATITIYLGPSGDARLDTMT
jgi:hypothetical protein